MSVIIMYHDGDYIGVAKNYKTAIKYLITYRYITGEDEVAPFVVTQNGGHFENGRLNEVVGPNWESIMINDWDIYKFNNFWDYWFSLEEATVYE